MMNALDWIRSKSTETISDTLVVEGETYKATTYRFRGNLPNRMATDVRKLLGELASSDFERETLWIGGQYRSDYGTCEYIRTVYQRIQ